jgi:hypothetical protein
MEVLYLSPINAFKGSERDGSSPSDLKTSIFVAPLLGTHRYWVCVFLSKTLERAGDAQVDARRVRVFWN